MIQRFKGKTVTAAVLAAVLLLEFLSPVALLAATGEADGGIKIAYFPMKAGRYGNKVSFRVHVSDEFELQSVSLVILDGDKPIRGRMTLLDEGPVPLQVRVRRAAPLYTAAKASAQSKNVFEAGEVLDVSQVSGEFLRVTSPYGKKGYILRTDVEVTSYGSAYAVTLPPSMTARSALTYRFEAVAAGLPAAVTPEIKMRLFTDEEINNLLAQYRKSGKASPPADEKKVAAKGQPKVTGTKPKAQVKKAPVSAKAPATPRPASTNRGTSVLAGLAIAGGLAYYFISRNKPAEENTAVLNVLIDWE